MEKEKPEGSAFDAIILTNRQTYFKGCVVGTMDKPFSQWTLGIDMESHPYIKDNPKLLGVLDVLVDTSHPYEKKIDKI